MNSSGPVSGTCHALFYIFSIKPSPSDILIRIFLSNVKL